MDLISPGTGCGDDHAEPDADPTGGEDLGHHGDADVVPGLIDLAVNVRRAAPPAWLTVAVTGDPARWAAYPDPAPARDALARAHGVRPREVLPLAGSAEAFPLLARAMGARRPVVVHPQFTAPEAALRTEGAAVGRVILRARDGFALDPDRVPTEADLVIVGNPTNPTGVLHPAAALRALRRPGRVLVVDEAFLDTVPGQPETLIGPDTTGVVVLRSLTKTWGIAGLRAGYAVGDPAILARLEAARPPWPVSTPALDALVACAHPAARAEAETAARALVGDRAVLVEALADAGFPVAGRPRAPFVLVDTSAAGPDSVRPALARAGFAVRRGETFPGLGPTWIRLAVRDALTSHGIAAALADLLPRPARTRPAPATPPQTGPTASRPTTTGTQPATQPAPQ